MGKTQEILELLNDLTYQEVLEIETAVKAKRKSFRPFRIKKKFKRCGKPGCTCGDGPANNEWGNLHGPYLTAQWREDGKTKTASLGREYSSDEISDAGNGLPNWFDFVISQEKFEKLSQDRQWETWERSLTPDEFESYYGLPQSDDMIGRPTKLRYDDRAFKAAYEASKQGNAVKWSNWGKYGVGTFRGIQELDKLVRQGYYFKE